MMPESTKTELGEELVIPLPTGNSLRCGEGGDHAFGGYVRVCDPDGNELVYWDANEWQEEPEQVMGAIFGASLSDFEELIKGRVLEDGVWNWRRSQAEADGSIETP